MRTNNLRKQYTCSNCSGNSVSHKVYYIKTTDIRWSLSLPFPFCETSKLWTSWEASWEMTQVQQFCIYSYGFMTSNLGFEKSLSIGHFILNETSNLSKFKLINIKKLILNWWHWLILHNNKPGTLTFSCDFN